MSDMRGKARKCWAKLSKKYGLLGLPWSSVHPMRQLEFCIALERHYPLLRLCNNHYKAKVFAHEDYTHWFKAKYPPPSDNAKTDSPWNRSGSTTHAILCNALQRSRTSGKQHGDDMDVDDDEEQWDHWEGIRDEENYNVIIGNNIQRILSPHTDNTQDACALTTPVEPSITRITAPTASQAENTRPSCARSI
ncbi:hypothetical protein EI94DRAFT_1803705 [Lactarius quietus]|nr:hypothetical protein EI94DRAFT_1803705 [Lactarius quietus]